MLWHPFILNVDSAECLKIVYGDAKERVYEGAIIARRVLHKPSNQLLLSPYMIVLLYALSLCVSVSAYLVSPPSR